MPYYTLNIKGRLMSLATPKVMGIVNVTPDSFFAGSRADGASAVRQRVSRMLAEGADIIDVGACSTRPGSQPVSEKEEMARLRQALKAVRSEAPQAVVSVDTFRPDVACMAVEECGADIINDVGSTATLPVGGNAQSPADVAALMPMMRMVARLAVPYVLTSQQPTLRQTLLFMASAVQALRELGHKDIIADPGFGFGKTIEQNYALLSALERLQVLELPVLTGLSRKSMITRALDITTDDALNGTTALHAVALMKGASILRVHDVKEAVQCVRLLTLLSTTDVTNLT